MTSFLDKRTGEGEQTAKKATLRRARKLSETKNWYADRYQSVSVQRNILFLFTLVLMGGLGLSIVMVAQLTNSKVFEPFVVEVEEKTGVITQISTHNIEKYTSDEAMIRSLLAQYFRAREGYDYMTFRSNHRNVVRLFSSNAVYGQFLAAFSASNKDSPINFGRNKRREVLIKSMTFLEPQKVQARLKLIDKMVRDNSVDEEHHVVVILTFDFKELELTRQERYVNPLGFQIQTYLLEKEVTDEN